MRTSPDVLRAFRQGFLAGLPFLIVLAPFALLFGVAATEAGFNLAEILGFSFLVLAGASQFIAVQMMVDNAPGLIVVATALAVNLRMAMYSASLAPHLGATPRSTRAFVAYFLFDQPYAMSIARYETDPPLGLDEKLGYYAGVAITCAVPWWSFSLIGFALGGNVPPAFALDFAVPITFLAMIAPMLRSPAHLGAAAVSIAAALVFAFLPYNLGVLIAAVLAMAAGAQIELWQERRRAAREAGR